ncbi:OmpA family protein [Salmonella enterica]|nr:OmpA family protein [Salmonella enterica]EDV3193669.1 OmpA family protein [Salmonella enterica]EDX3113944.1 OmpA family protein [Salmonella enterica subsp. enterica serovar Mississippi]
MRNMLKRAVLLWGLALLLALWLVFFQASAAVRFAVTAVMIVTAAALAFWRRKGTPAGSDDAWLSHLPPETYRQPVVLVCGDISPHLFAEHPLRQVAQGLYLHVPDEEQLAVLADRLLAVRPAWATQLAVGFIVTPVLHRDAAVLAGVLRRFAHNVAGVRRKAGVKVPLLLWSYLPGATVHHDLPWFICAGGNVRVATSTGEQAPAVWAAQSGKEACRQRFSHLLRTESLMQWLYQTVLPEMEPCLPLALGISPPSALPEVESNLWQTWITTKAGLTPDIAEADMPNTLPFPDAMLALLPRQSGFTPVRRACVTALLMNTVAGVAALCLSASANRSLLRQVGDDLHQYYAVPVAEFITKARHLSVLKDDANMLDAYFRQGEPLRLGLGLYPGEQIRQPVLRAIRDYRPPEQKIEVAASLQVQTVRLDSMALFDVGQSRLKDGSTKVLVNALVNIKAKPGWLILVAGYTDATGDDKANRQLSLRRAEAVRDWMLQTSDIPASCFAVQGLGESQPAATNDTSEGRAANRRVEISLVPRSDACQGVKQNRPPEPAVFQSNEQGE